MEPEKIGEMGRGGRGVHWEKKKKERVGKRKKKEHCAKNKYIGKQEAHLPFPVLWIYL